MFRSDINWMRSAADTSVDIDDRFVLVVLDATALFGTRKSTN